MSKSEKSLAHVKRVRSVNPPRSASSQKSPRLLINTILILLFSGLQIADGIVTYLGLTIYELLEINPILNYLGVALGLGLGQAIFLVKMLVLSLIAAVFVTRHSIRGLWGTVTLAFAVMFYSGAVINNILLTSSL